MISNDCFLDLVDAHLGRNLRESANQSQLRAVMYDEDPILQIVAGPGSGKTSVLVLRALRYVFVQDVLPEHVLITTFTRKAARELRTRWLDWGYQLVTRLGNSHSLDHIDLNRCQIDTLDSTIHDVLTEFRPAGELSPEVADTSASLLILKRQVFQTVYYSNRDVIDSLLSNYTLGRQPPRNQGEALRTTKRLLERLVQDRVDLGQYRQAGPAENMVVEMLLAYRQICVDTNVFDFAMLEEHFQDRLSNGHLNEWTKDLRVLLIDEYQDTNPLQEAIYFSLIGSTELAPTIVGDDDQSMYRFRGGSVELFTDFADRCRQSTGRLTNRVDMVRNFRSHPEIIGFFNDHIATDPEFQPARINPSKPLVTPARSSAGIPVLGMFRPSEAALASDLANFLQRFADRHRIPVGDSGQEIYLSADGALGDAVCFPIRWKRSPMTATKVHHAFDFQEC